MRGKGWGYLLLLCQTACGQTCGAAERSQPPHAMDAAQSAQAPRASTSSTITVEIGCGKRFKRQLARLAAGTVSRPLITTDENMNRPVKHAQTQVAAFLMDVAEVTLGEYQLCSACGTCPELKVIDGVDGLEHCTVATNAVERAANCVTYEEAATFCKWVGGRLPTNAEWELAYRGAQNRKFPWGDAAPDRTRAKICFTLPNEECVDAYPGEPPAVARAAGRSPEGIYDLLGNVDEWVTGDPDPARAPRQVLRGGNMQQTSPTTEAELIRDASPKIRLPNFGFRCVMDADKSP